MRFEPVPGFSNSGTGTPSRRPAASRGGRRRRATPLRRASVAAVQMLESRMMLSAALIKDINTLLADANPQHFVASNGTLYFRADDGYHGTQLWKTDGTAAGTVVVPELVPGVSNTALQDMTDVSGTLYFFAQGPSDGSVSGLWKSDGTPAGTSELFRVGQPGNLTNADGTLYFTAWNGNIPTPAELFKTDGTAVGTTPVASVPNATMFSYADGMLFFLEGTTLWKSDGTAAGTVALGTIDNGAGVIAPEAVVAVGRDRVFAVDSGELWTSDGTAAGTQRIDTSAHEVVGLINDSGTLYFATHGFGDQLWTSDGTDPGTVLVKNIPSTTYDDQPGAFALVNGTLYFNAHDDAHGEELWRSDGTTAGTSLVADINPGPANAIGVAKNWVGAGAPIASMGRDAFGTLNGEVYFGATDGTHGMQLWHSGGTAAGTAQVAQINTTNIGSGISGPVTVGGITYFTANDGVHGDELWKTDGTPAGTSMVMDLNPGSAGSDPWILLNDSGTLYFEASDGAATNLYKTDGTAAGTTLVASQLWASDLTAVGDHLFYFSYRSPSPGTGSVAIVALNEIDAATGQTTELQSLTPYIAQAGVATMTQFGGKLFYTGLDASGHLQLWERDPFGDNAAVLVQTFAGAAPQSEQLLAAGGALYFAADDGTTGPALWTTDGATAGTHMVWATGRANYFPASLHAAGGAVYFTLANEPYGSPNVGAYKTDGTGAGTIQLTGAANVGTFTAAGGKVYFYASSSPEQPGTLYVTDGTVAGTRAVDPALSIWSGYSGVEPMLVADGLLYFIASDATHGTQIWQTDGTTTMLADPSNTSNSYTPDWLLGRASGGLVFTATDLPHGTELWDLPVVAPSPATAAFVKSDSSTEGNWTGTYGADGYAIANGATSLPSYVQLATSGASTWTWQQPSNWDWRTLQTSPGSADRLAACDYSDTSFTYDLNLTDGQAHQVALYALNWDWWSYRNETITISDANTGAVLDSRNLGNFNNGQWLVWNLSGHVKIMVTNNGGLNAVASGLFFGPPAPSASFVRVDTTTQGAWTGVYGADGYSIFNGATNLPAYAQLSTRGANTWTWATASSTTDNRDLQTGPGAVSRIAACDYSDTSFTYDLNLTDGQVHQVALYGLNWDWWSYRNETITITDANTGAVLDSRNLANFNNGQWLVWNLSGHVKITLTNNSGLNAVASGIFFG